MRKLCVFLLLTFLCLAQSGTKSGIDRSALDTTCKPCDDFWRYANGSWLDKNPIPADQARWGTFDVLIDANRERLKTILDGAAANRQAGDERRLGDLYASCMDTGAIEAAGAKPLQSELRRIAAIRSRQDLEATLLALEPEGRLGPTWIDSDPDPTNSDQMIAFVLAGGLSLPDRDYYFRTDERSKTIRNEFVEHVKRTLQLLGDSTDAAAAEAKTILDFETVFAQATLTNVDRRDPNKQFHEMALVKLEELAPDYEWKEVLKLLGVPESIAINVTEPEFMKTMNRQLREAPLETWKTWLRWRLANDRSEYLSKVFYDEWFRFNTAVLRGVKEQQPRWKICVAMADSQMGDALGRLYVEKYFPPEAKRRMTEMVENLRAALGDELRQADWLEPQTRESALRKLTNFYPKIGYPEKWRDYGRVKVNLGEYVANIESAVLENRRFELAKIGKKVDRTQWFTTAPTVNAYYSEQENSINFPAGILQPPFFIFDADDAVNYGAIGAVIGHEMGHGFDDQGSKFDAQGNLKNWWTDADRKKFEVRAACVTDQFDSIDVGNGLHHNGKLVTGEAMGDLGGLTVAYKAYHRSLNGKEAPVLDGFTGDQRFFLAFARNWAGQSRPEAERLQLNNNPHPLQKYRANATLQNMPEFQAAFACQRGDPMVRPPQQQCRLW